MDSQLVGFMEDLSDISAFSPRFYMQGHTQTCKRRLNVSGILRVSRDQAMSRISGPCPKSLAANTDL